MKIRKTIHEVIPNWILGEGIFNALNSLDVPWRADNISASLDMEYIGNISGNKYISPLLSKIMSSDILTTDELSSIAKLIYDLNILNWRKEWATLNLEYDPIENYNSVEIMKDDITKIDKGTTHTRTDNTSHAKTGTDTNTPDITELRTPNLTNSGTDSVSGFNSDNLVVSAGNTAQQTGTESVRTSGNTRFDYNTTERDTGTVTDTDEGSDTHTRNYELTRKGNIGVTTSQQMIEAERELYMWNYFYSVVFPAIDRVMTIPIY